MRPLTLTASLALVVLAGGTGSAATRIDSAWPLVAFGGDGDCRLEVTGNGKVFLIAATGLGGGNAGHLVLTNGDMKPIDWAVRATDAGRLARYYLPFRWGHADERIDGGLVRVSISTRTCRISAAFPWKREIRVID